MIQQSVELMRRHEAYLKDLDYVPCGKVPQRPGGSKSGLRTAYLWWQSLCRAYVEPMDSRGFPLPPSPPVARLAEWKDQRSRAPSIT